MVGTHYYVRTRLKRPSFNGQFAADCQRESVPPLQCSPHNSNPLNKNFRLLRKNPGSHRRNNTKNLNGKIRLNRRSKIQFTS